MQIESQVRVKISDQEDRLFEVWRTRRPGSVPDGLADEQAYLKSSPRILLIMKEVNDPEDPSFDLRRFMRDGGRPQTWDNVTRWVLGIRNLEREIRWRALRTIVAELRTDTLRSLGAMNLKKSAGGHTTESRRLRDVAREDSDLLKMQFALYQPDLIICCGSDVSKLFGPVVQGARRVTWKLTSRGVRVRPYGEQGWIIAFAHPEARVGDNLLYYGLVDAVRELDRVGRRPA